MAKVLNVGRHPVDLEGGAMLAPGAVGEADPSHPHTAGQIDAGLLKALEDKPRRRGSGSGGSSGSDDGGEA